MGELTTSLYGVNPPKQIKLNVTSKGKEKYGSVFPMGSTLNKGHIPKMSGIKLLQNNAAQLILTEKGERIMLPQFGMNLRKYLFEPLTKDIFSAIRAEIIHSISTFMPEVTILKVAVKETSKINIEGGRGLVVILLLSANELNNTVFNVGAVVV